MYRENYIESLRAELVEMVSGRLTPIALKYGYADVPLEANIKWRPQVLVLGNYSSGKSTLINELLGGTVQQTGQAPTDDSFTVITQADGADRPPGSAVELVEERDGKVLLNDPEFPFEILKKHGQRFASHFRLKKVSSPFLNHLAIIDTPGMLDSIAERDRGYDYQEVIGDLAQIVDLVLVLFDPHKAGTVREAHASLRDTLPTRTFEDRVLFVLNRIDECASLNDLLRVYGTLCWNLSQMTGRKDIPAIRLTYSPNARHSVANEQKPAASAGEQGPRGFLQYLENQRDELKAAILQAPRHRLDHLATYVETHGERLAHFLEAMLAYKRDEQKFKLKYFLGGLFASLWVGAGGFFLAQATALLPDLDDEKLLVIGGGLAVVTLIAWMTLLRSFFASGFHRNRLRGIDDLTPLQTQSRKDSWSAVRDLAYTFLKKTNGAFRIKDIKNELADVGKVRDKGSKEIREALNELSTIRHTQKSSRHSGYP